MHLIYAVGKRRHLIEVMNILYRVHPKAFITVEDICSSTEGIFPAKKHMVSGETAKIK
ncbi:MAG: DUF2179 domain-containing protein [Anaerolineaceae bacterium]|nr:DUF2179 domain-containing protein [Anaerolineaceae bacterium]